MLTTKRYSGLITYGARGKQTFGYAMRGIYDPVYDALALFSYPTPALCQP
ncbi:hypothetical [Yersinia pestis KIM10+]|uniref:Uncharacterized protein n=1 Tax=Yersinia pestis TaxID=632 RepID=Q8CL27_YERPE|nr:hypothetical [Yersinia pestis KIM10+]